MSRVSVADTVALVAGVFGVLWVVFEFSYNKGSAKSTNIDDRQDKELHDIKESISSMSKAVENQSRSIEILSINQKNIIKTLDGFSDKLGSAVNNIDENQEQILKHHIIQTSTMKNQEKNSEQILILFKEILNNDR